ncbi:MAG: PqqD family protein [Bacteroidales bacterium]|nr:PqqD family protein [Bacteroidales bacterium]
MEHINQIKSKVVCRKIDEEMVLVPLVNDVADMNVIYTLNEVAAFIWEQIDGVKSIEDITKLVLQNFDTDAQTAEKDVSDFIRDLNQIVN